MKRYAYIRVSTKEQNTDRQLMAVEPYHIPKNNIYCDYQSGKDFERPSYHRLRGDVYLADLCPAVGPVDKEVFSHKHWQQKRRLTASSYASYHPFQVQCRGGQETVVFRCL